MNWTEAEFTGQRRWAFNFTCENTRYRLAVAEFGQKMFHASWRVPIEQLFIEFRRWHCEQFTEKGDPNRHSGNTRTGKGGKRFLLQAGGRFAITFADTTIYCQIYITWFDPRKSFSRGLPLFIMKVWIRAKFAKTLIHYLSEIPKFNLEQTPKWKSKFSWRICQSSCSTHYDHWQDGWAHSSTLIFFLLCFHRNRRPLDWERNTLCLGKAALYLAGHTLSDTVPTEEKLNLKSSHISKQSFLCPMNGIVSGAACSRNSFCWWLRLSRFPLRNRICAVQRSREIGAGNGNCFWCFSCRLKSK